MTQLRYFYLGPEVLSTPGYVYGRSSSEERQEVEVERVPSERWKELGAFHVLLPVEQVLRREVSADEALSGVGTYVGSCICVVRRHNGGEERWAYGVVTGYRCFMIRDLSVLHVMGLRSAFQVSYEEGMLQDLAIETYAMHLCEGKSVLAVMPAEMRGTNRAVYDLFYARGRTAVRDVAEICRRIGVESGEGDGKVPLFEMVAMEVVNVSIKYVLDYAFYREGGRRAPESVILGSSGP